MSTSVSKTEPVDPAQQMKTTDSAVAVRHLWKIFGSGKSTLVRLLTRLIEPTAGGVEIDGQNIVAASHRELRELRRNHASLVLAANQGLLFVLAMVVIGGMVGAGALGYDVVLGFSRFEEWGKGAAAGVTIVLLGIMLDRIARAAAARTGGTHQATSRGAHGSARFRIGKALTFKR